MIGEGPVDERDGKGRDVLMLLLHANVHWLSSAVVPKAMTLRVLQQTLIRCSGDSQFPSRDRLCGMLPLTDQPLPQMWHAPETWTTWRRLSGIDRHGIVSVQIRSEMTW